MKNHQKIINNFLFRISSEIANKAKELAPYQTGNLKNDIQVFDQEINNHRLFIGNSKITPYAKYVHEGTKPYTIKPKKAKTLRIKGVGYRKSAKHPGIKANQYLQDGFNQYTKSSSYTQAKKDLVNELGTELSKEITKNLKFKDIKLGFK